MIHSQLRVTLLVDIFLALFRKRVEADQKNVNEKFTAEKKCRERGGKRGFAVSLMMP